MLEFQGHTGRCGSLGARAWEYVLALANFIHNPDNKAIEIYICKGWRILFSVGTCVSTMSKGYISLSVTVRGEVRGVIVCGSRGVWITRTVV